MCICIYVYMYICVCVRKSKYTHNVLIPSVPLHQLHHLLPQLGKGDCANPWRSTFFARLGLSWHWVAILFCFL